MTDYEIQEQAAQYTIDPITIDHVTSENIAEKMAEKNIETLYDTSGNPVGYYADTIMSVQEPGKQTTSEKVQVFLVPVKDTVHSTQDNTIIDWKVVERQPGDNTLPGGQVIYLPSQDAATDTLKAAGYDVDMPPEMWNYFWEQYYNNDEDGFIIKGGKWLIDTATGIPGAGDIMDVFKGRSDYAMYLMKMSEVGGVTMPWVGNEDIGIAKLLQTAAQCGLTDVGQIMEDDPTTKQLFRTLEAGATVNLTPVGDRDGSLYDENWQEAFIKPMTTALMVNPSRNFPTPTQWDEDYLAWPNMDMNIAYYLDQQVYAAVNKHINIWCARYGSNVYTGNKDQVRLWGSYIDPQLDWYVYANYPEDRGYAILYPTGTYYRPLEYVRSFPDSPAAFTGGGSDNIGNQPQFMLVYDQETFYNYLDTLGQNNASQLVNNMSIIFSNGTIAEKNPYSSKNRDDALKITVNSTIADIITEIENDPVWPDTKITIPEYDPTTDTTVNHYYYNITPGADDPRQQTPYVPEVTNPINAVIQYPTIPSAISTPIQNDPVTPTAGSSKFWTIYKPSDAQMELLGGELWQQNAIQILKQTFVNPTDGIISWSQVFLDPESTRNDYIYLGDYKTGVSGVPVVDNPKVYKYFGIIDVPRYFNDYRDYTETQVSVYLPFIGFMDLDSRDVIGCKITLEYYMDVITGTCVATLSPKVGDNAECAYQFTGNCGVQLPITAADRSRLLSGLLSGATSGAKLGAAGGPGGAVAGAVLGGAIGAVSGAFGGVQKSNGFSANAGALTKYKTPYILIHRSIPADPILYDQYYGNPASVTATLRNLHGFTRVRECYVDVPRATDAEKAMIEAQLKQGVILP